MNTNYDLVIVGLGPSGIASALEASKKKNFKILCIDQGLPFSERNVNIKHGKTCKCNEKYSCDVLSGFGGSSMISGTKLSEYPAGSGLVNIVKDLTLIKNKTAEVINYFKKELELLVDSEDIKLDEIKNHYRQYNYDIKYYNSFAFNEKKYYNLLEKQYQILLQRNVKFFFKTQLNNILNDGTLKKLIVTSNKTVSELKSKNIIFAMGKSGYNKLHLIGNDMDFKRSPSSLEIGVRLEFPSCLFENIDKYQKDLKLKSGNSRTYCISKNGEIVNYNYNGNYFTEGRVRKSKKTDFTNLAIVTRIPGSENNLKIYEKIIKNYKINNDGNIINLSYEDLLSKNSISGILPESIYNELKKEVIKFITSFIEEKEQKNVKLYFFEQDFPISEYEVTRSFEIKNNIYIVGASTGKFRGIIQSFLSGILCVEQLLKENNE